MNTYNFFSSWPINKEEEGVSVPWRLLHSQRYRDTTSPFRDQAMLLHRWEMWPHLRTVTPERTFRAAPPVAYNIYIYFYRYSLGVSNFCRVLCMRKKNCIIDFWEEPKVHYNSPLELIPNPFQSALRQLSPETTQALVPREQGSCAELVCSSVLETVIYPSDSVHWDSSTFNYECGNNELEICITLYGHPQ